MLPLHAPLAGPVRMPLSGSLDESNKRKNNAKWCRYCGAFETSRWRKSAHGYPLCNPCGIKANRGQIELPEKEPEKPIDDTKNSMFAYLRVKAGYNRASIHAKTRHLLEMRNKVYKKYKKDIFAAKINRQTIEEILGYKPSNALNECQGEIVSLYPIFDPRDVGYWVRLEDLIANRNSELAKAKHMQKKILDDLCSWRKKLTDVHRETLHKLRELENDQIFVNSRELEVAGPSESDFKTSMLAQAAMATTKTDMKLIVASKDVEFELNALFNAFFTMKRELPHRLNQDIRLCKELCDEIRRKISEVKKWIFLPDFGSGKEPEKRIYEKYLKERFEGIDSKYIYDDYKQIRTWNLANGGEVTVGDKKFTLILFKDDLDLLHRHVKWISSAPVHTFFLPKVSFVAAIGAVSMILVPKQLLSVPTLSTIQPSDYVRQLIQVMLICESSACPQGWEEDVPRILPLQQEQIYVTSQQCLQIWPQTEALDRSYYPPEGSGKRHRNINFNIGMLLFMYFYRKRPVIDQLSGKCVIPWPRSDTNAHIVRYIPLMRCLLNVSVDKPMQLANMQYLPVVMSSGSLCDIRDTFEQDIMSQQLLKDFYALFSERQRAGSSLSISVGRSTIVMDMLNALSGLDLSGDLFYRNLEFKFADENGIGAGVTQAVYQKFASELLQHSIFQSLGGSYMPFVASKKNSLECAKCGGKCQFLVNNPIEMFSAIGVFFSLILTRRILIRMPLSRLLVHYLLGVRNPNATSIAEQLQSNHLKLLIASTDFDPEIMKTHARYRDVADISEYELTWDNLKHNQRNAVITNESLDEYLKLKLIHDLFGVREPWLMTLKESFQKHAFIKEHISSFKPHIMHPILFGRSVPTSDEIMRACFFSPEPDTPETLDLREAFGYMIVDFSERKRAKFVEWVTGAEVISNDPNFRISIEIKRGEHGGWPNAQTCFRKLYIPLYDFFFANDGNVVHEENRRLLSEKFQQAWKMGGDLFLNR